MEKGKQMKNTLADLLKNIPQVNSAKAAVYGLDYVFGCAADYLIENGVTIPVRCNDCKNYYTHTCPMLAYTGMKPDDYCSYGERRTNDSRT